MRCNEMGIAVKTDLTGRIFGKLRVDGFCGANRHLSRVWRCVCDCGNIREVTTNRLMMGTTVSCGCHKNAVFMAMITTHGKCQSPAYRVWEGMISRCFNKNNKRFKDYGGRGVTVCERWMSFSSFLEDVGERPCGKTLDRWPDMDGNYEPGNTRWATPIQQQRNMRSNHMVEFNGESRCVSEWAQILGINKSTLSKRLSRGWTIERAMTT